MAKAESRIYTVSDGDTDQLVRAFTRSQALRHIAEETFTTRVATQDDIILHLTNGGKVLDATTDAVDPEPTKPSEEPQLSATDASIETGDAQ